MSGFAACRGELNAMETSSNDYKKIRLLSKTFVATYMVERKQIRPKSLSSRGCP